MHPYKDVPLWSLIKPGVVPLVGVLGFVSLPQFCKTRAGMFATSASSACVLMFGNQMLARYTSLFDD